MSMRENEEPLSFSYTFTPQETSILARFIRWHTLPDGLEKFSDAIFDTVYNAMTIDDAEKLFKK